MNTLKHSPKSALIFGLIGGFMAVSLNAETFVREMTREFTAQPDQQLSIDVGSGQIEVRAGDAATVSVEVIMSVKSKSGEKAEEIFDNTLLEFSEDADEVSVKTGTLKKKAKSWFGFKRSKLPEIKVIATCPPNFDLNLDTGSGNILVEDISGQMILDTGSGSITGSNLGGALSADTGSGSVTIQNLLGNLIADTGSGSINASGIEGTFSGDTGSGSINASGLISEFSADTGSGSIHISTSAHLVADSTADSGSGSIHIELPLSSNFSFAAKNNSGDFECAFPELNIRDQGKRHIKGSVGENGPQLTLEAGSGDIRIIPRT